MKKAGFTLAEILITMGIIGVVMAITGNILSKVMPDESKIKVLKAYNLVSEINNKLVNNPSFYIEQEQGTYIALGLADFSVPSDKSYSGSIYKGAMKYARLLASNMELIGNPTDTSSGAKFTTVDGIYWEVSTTRTSNNGYWYATSIIKIDIDPNSSSNCYCGQTGCNNPDIYKFSVDTYGHVQGDDPLTKAYLLNPYKLNDKKTDYAKAKTL